MNGLFSAVPWSASVEAVLGTAGLIFAFLLIFTGIAKIRRPLDTGRALSSLGLPPWSGWGVVVAGVELASATFVVATLQPAAFAIQGMLYCGFAIWIVVALAKDVPVASCGCLGTPDTPPYWGHLAVDLTGAAVSFAAAGIGGNVYPDSLPRAVAMTLVAGVGAFLCWMIIGDGARLTKRATG